MEMDEQRAGERSRVETRKWGRSHSRRAAAAVFPQDGREGKGHTGCAREGTTADAIICSRLIKWDPLSNQLSPLRTVGQVLTALDVQDQLQKLQDFGRAERCHCWLPPQELLIASAAKSAGRELTFA